MKKSYSTIFFDLDHTLWDFDRNSTETLTELVDELKLIEKGVSSTDVFLQTYRSHNRRLWTDYEKNLIPKSDLRVRRFHLTLSDFGIEDTRLAETLADKYLISIPTKKNLFPGTVEVLTHLKKRYELFIITNGFKEVQHLKLHHSNLHGFFSGVFISEEIGFKKPQPEIFHHAVRIANSSISRSIMIGDTYETDILGAISIGMDQVYFDPFKAGNGFKATYRITDLRELKGIL